MQANRDNSMALNIPLRLPIILAMVVAAGSRSLPWPSLCRFPRLQLLYATSCLAMLILVIAAIVVAALVVVPCRECRASLKPF
jgi:hypothetical protein